MREFTYFRRIQIAVAAPLILTCVFLVGGVCVAVRRRRRRDRIAMTRSRVRRARARGSYDSVLKDGMWIAAPAALFFIDLCPSESLQSTFFRSSGAALHSYGPDAHSC